jgi:hypothetical protein
VVLVPGVSPPGRIEGVLRGVQLESSGAHSESPQGRTVQVLRGAQ